MTKEISGIKTQTGQIIFSDNVILTSGTFLNGLIHIGDAQYGGGRSGERASVGITACLENMGFISGRLKTGTPPRIDGRTVNYNKLEIQYGDNNPQTFSFLKNEIPTRSRQLNCWIAYTDDTCTQCIKNRF